jgi:hypothetical protein
MAKRGARKVVKPVAAAAVTLGTIASIWWFALKPRRKAKHDAATTPAPAPAPPPAEPESGTSGTEPRPEPGTE